MDIDNNTSTAIIGTYIGVDTSYMEGSAYIYQDDLEYGKWKKICRLNASDANGPGPYYSDDWNFGRSVSINGDIAVVGAPKDNSVYVFKHNKENNTWQEMQKLVASDYISEYAGFNIDDFGHSVSVYGNAIIVGA